MPPATESEAASSAAPSETNTDAAGQTPADASASASPSSPDLTADTQAPAPQPQGEQSAATPAAPVDDHAELLKVAQAVVQPAADKTPSQGEDAAAPDAQVPKTETPVPDPLDGDPTDAELTALPPKTKRRVEQLLKQRGEARAQVETLKPDAAKWQQMDGYLTRNALAAEDVNLLLGVGSALRRGDFKAFLDGVMPYVDLCRENLGLSIPADLQSRVDAGEMTTEAATELSTARASNVRLNGQAEAARAAVEQERQQQEANRAYHAVNDAVGRWEQEIRSRDPDYPRKADAVVRVSQALIAEHGRPTTAEAAVELAKRAYQETNRMFTAMLPRPVPSRPVPNGSSAASNNVRAEPRNMMEHVMASLEAART